jgi:hypothetical protein
MEWGVQSQSFGVIYAADCEDILSNGDAVDKVHCFVYNQLFNMRCTFKSKAFLLVSENVLG